MTAEIDRQVEERGYCTVPDVLIGIGMLGTSAYNEWKKGNVFCLEDACSADLPRKNFRLIAFRRLKNDRCAYRLSGCFSIRETERRQA